LDGFAKYPIFPKHENSPAADLCKEGDLKEIKMLMTEHEGYLIFAIPFLVLEELYSVNVSGWCGHGLSTSLVGAGMGSNPIRSHFC